MIQISEITPDVELAGALQDQVSVGLLDGSTATVAVYSDWERPTNNLPDDFIVCYINGDVSGVGMDTPFAKGDMMVNLYCRLNDDGSVKKNRVKKLLAQLDSLIEKKSTEHFYFYYDADRFITPTTPNQTSGYSVTSLNVRWNTNSNFNKPVTP